MDLHERRLEEENIRGLLQAARRIVDGYLKKEGDEKRSQETSRLADYLKAISQKLQAAEMEIEGASTQIPYGTDQLSGVTRFTEQEIHRVLGFAEKALASHDKLLSHWDGLKGDLRQGINSPDHRNRRFVDVEAALEDEKKTLMDLMTALSFQDVAAQWLKKISSDMNGVQSRIKRLNGSLSPRAIDSGRQTVSERAGMADTFSKTTGRFSGSGKMAQADVDRLLKEHGL